LANLFSTKKSIAQQIKQLKRAKIRLILPSESVLSFDTESQDEVRDEVGVSPSFDIPPLARDEVQDKSVLSVQDESADQTSFEFFKKILYKLKFTLYNISNFG
jgi:hypothetical protein